MCHVVLFVLMKYRCNDWFYFQGLIEIMMGLGFAVGPAVGAALFEVSIACVQTKANTNIYL